MPPRRPMDALKAPALFFEVVESESSPVGAGPGGNRSIRGALTRQGPHPQGPGQHPRWGVG